MTTPVRAPEEEEQPVTVVVSRRVRPGCEAAYETWLQRLLDSVRDWPGYLGTTVQRPGPGAPREYTSVFRFATLAHLQAFEQSGLRRDALLAVAPLVEADARWTQLSGFELWFAAPTGTIVPQPSRARMALLMTVVVYVLVLSLGAVVGRILGDVPFPVRLLVTIVIEVALMTWVIMPRLTRALARWIYPAPRATS